MTTKERAAQNKRYLSQYREQKIRLKRIEAEYEECIESSALPSVNSDGMPHAHVPHGLDVLAIKIESITNRYRTQQRECIEALDEITWNVDQMEDEIERSVLIYRYISGDTWEKVAEKVHMSRQSVYRIHGSALLNFNIISATKK